MTHPWGGLKTPVSPPPKMVSRAPPQPSGAPPPPRGEPGHGCASIYFCFLWLWICIGALHHLRGFFSFWHLLGTGLGAVLSPQPMGRGGREQGAGSVCQARTRPLHTKAASFTIWGQAEPQPSGQERAEASGPGLRWRGTPGPRGDTGAAADPAPLLRGGRGAAGHAARGDLPRMWTRP